MRVIPARSAESKRFVEDVERAMAITAKINRLTYADADEVMSLFMQLTSQKVGQQVRVIPPFFTDCGKNISVGDRVFINQNCTFYALADIIIGDDVLIGPNVSLVTSEHPIPPSRRRDGLIGRPIVIAQGAWIAAGAIVIGGVTIGENSVVAAGSVVTRDVAPNVLVGGNPARLIRRITEE